MFLNYNIILVCNKRCKWRGLIIESVSMWYLESWRGISVSVLGVPMSSQVHLPLKGFLAESTGEGLVASVLAHMSDQVRALTKSF